MLGERVAREAEVNMGPSRGQGRVPSRLDTVETSRADRSTIQWRADVKKLEGDSGATSRVTGAPGVGPGAPVALRENGATRGGASRGDRGDGWFLVHPLLSWSVSTGVRNFLLIITLFR